MAVLDFATQATGIVIALRRPDRCQPVLNIDLIHRRSMTTKRKTGARQRFQDKSRCQTYPPGLSKRLAICSRRPGKRPSSLDRLTSLGFSMPAISMEWTAFPAPRRQ
jgi:hypothetical protein